MYLTTLAEHNDTGRAGEKLAMDFLKEKGFAVLETNWRNGRLELDIIARDGGTLVFVEVKTRSSNLHGFPEDSVDASKQDRICNAAESYIEQNQWQAEIRFDLISITLEGPDSGIHHIPDAFFPYQ